MSAAAAAFHWPCITATLFDVTLPEDIHAQLGGKKTNTQQFSSFSTKSNACLHAGKVLDECKNNSKTQLINLDLPTQRSFVCVCRVPRLALMKHIDRGTYAGKSRGTLLNYSCGPKAIHQNSCCTAATLHPRILYRRVSLFCFATCMTFTTNGAGERIFSSGFMSTTITNRQGDVNEALIYRFMM